MFMSQQNFENTRTTYNLQVFPTSEEPKQ